MTDYLVPGVMRSITGQLGRVAQVRDAAPIVDPTWYGAVVDTDCTAAFQAAIDHVASTSMSGAVLIPDSTSGDWWISQLTLRQGVTLRSQTPALHDSEGTARQHGRLVHVPDSPRQHMIVLETPELDYVWAAGVSGAVFVGATDSGDAIHFDLPGRVIISDCAFSGFDRAIQLDGAIDCDVVRPIINYCRESALVIASVAAPSTTVVVDRGYVRSSPRLATIAGIGVTFRGTTFESNTGTDSAALITGASQVAFDHCYSENVLGGFIESPAAESIVVTGGKYGGPNAGVTAGDAFADVGDVNSLVITGATIARFDKFVKTTVDTDSVVWQSNHVAQHGTTPWSALNRPSHVRGDWRYETSPGLSGASVASQFDLVDDYGTKIRLVNGYSQGAAEFTVHAINTATNETTVALVVDPYGNVLPAGFTAPTTAMADGFVMVPAAAGPPTGAPRARGGKVPIYVDTANGRIYTYYGGAWHYLSLT